MKKLISGIAAFMLVAGAALFANSSYNTSSDCCEEGSSCCYAGSACCTK